MDIDRTKTKLPELVNNLKAVNERKNKEIELQIEVINKYKKLYADIEDEEREDRKKIDTLENELNKKQKRIDFLEHQVKSLGRLKTKGGK